MENKEHHRIKNPSKKQLALTTTACLTGTILLGMAATDFFSQSVFNGSFLMLFLLSAGAFFTVGEQYINFFRNRKEEKNE